MENRIEFARRLVAGIGEQAFRVMLYADEGGSGCSGGWYGYDTLFLDENEVLWFIKKACSHKEIFDGMELPEVNLQPQLEDLATYGAWQGGMPRFFVDSCIPEELSDLEDYLCQDEDEADDEDKEYLAGELDDIEEDDYNFIFHVADGDECYYFEEDLELELHLTRDEVLALLRNEYPECKMLEELCEDILDKSFLEDRADEVYDVDEYDHHIYGGHLDPVEDFAEAWARVLDGIIDGTVTEENLERSMSYITNQEYKITED